MKFLSLFLSSLAISASLFGANNPAPDASLPDGVEHIQTLNGIEEYQLTSNNLRVLLVPNKCLPVASVMVTYMVGSRNEVTGTTGATHILEHMMFKGTERFNSSDGSDYSSQMERIGARSNATTYFDRTNYYAVLPSEYVSLAIELEADRMRNLRIREEDLASEMTVVRNEYERGENNPIRTLIKEIYATAFMAQPYGHPTIGWLSDIENTNTQKLREFYDIFYWPENTYLTIIGGFDKVHTLDAIIEHYAEVPNSPNPIPQVETIEPEQLGARRLTIERPGQVGVVAIAYKVPAGTHDDWAALWLLQQMIGADKTGRLYRALDDKGKASATYTFAPQLRDPSLFFFAAYMTPDATHEETESIMLDEIGRVVANGVSQDELARAKSVIQANTVYGRDGPYAIASEINEAIAMGDWTTYVTIPEAIQNVTIEDIQRVARDYFIPRNSTTGWFVPQDTTVASDNGRIHGPNYFRDPEIFDSEQNHPSSPAELSPSAPTVVDFASKMQRTTIGGIELIAIDVPINDVVSFVGSFAAGDSLSPADAPTLASLTAAMLDQGTERNDRFAIAKRLDTLGAGITFAADSHSLSFSGQFLSNDAGLVMGLLAEQLRLPAFDPDVLETLKTRQKAGLLQALESTDYLAEAELSRQLYPVGHPNYSEKIETLLADLDETTIEDIRTFHTEHYGPKSMTLVFAGDINFDQLSAAVETAFGDWSGGVDYPAEHPAALENEARSERIRISDKPSVSVRYGYNTELRRTDEEYLPFMVGNYLLGGSFSSKLMQEVRKKRGLTYSIYSHHTGDIMTAGNWQLGVSLAPAMLNDGLNATDSVLKDWYANGVTEEEVQAAIQTLKGSYMVRLSTTGSIAGQVHSFVQRGMGADYVDLYPQQLDSITAADVNAAIKKHLNPKNLSKAMAGSFGEANPASLPTSTAQTQKVTVRIDTPDAGWSVKIDHIYQVNDNLVVISKLEREGDMAAQVISTVSDTVTIPAVEEGTTIRHYILGRTWNWGDKENYSFIDDLSLLQNAIQQGELIYESE